MARRKVSKLNALKLKTQWVIFLIVGALTIVTTNAFVVQLEWTIVASLVFLGQNAILYFDLPMNHAKKQTKLLPVFGMGTWLSLLRLLVLSLLAGFLLTPRPQGELAWAPFILYLMFNSIDLIDGYAARRSKQLTRLGEKLDLDLDSRGMLVGALLAVRFGTVGWWYVLVGMARYIYVAALWVSAQFGLRVREQPNPNSRPLAGLQMGIGTALLAPVLQHPFTILVASMTMTIFLANFFYDWLVAIGRVPAVKRPWLSESVRGISGLGLRVILFVLIMMRAAVGAGAGLGFVELILGALLLAGIGTRLVSLILLISLGISLQAGSLDLIAMTITLAGLALVYVGPGSLTLWAPENLLIRKRLGDKKI